MPQEDKFGLFSPLSQTSLREGEDFYRDGPYVVFTQAYHLRRGSCCASGCRHCPYRDANPAGQEEINGDGKSQEPLM